MEKASNVNNQRYTWHDYQGWDDGQRWEVIEGEAFAMSPSPNYRHQCIVGDLYLQLRNYFNDKSCEVLLAPLDVKLSEQDIVQPDIFVIYNQEQIKGTYIEGPPKLTIEIISPTSLQHDRLRKTQLYSKSGVPEYWLVTPYPSLVEVLLLEGSNYRIHRVYGKDDLLKSPTFQDMTISLPLIFNFPISSGERIQEIQESTPPYGP